MMNAYLHTCLLRQSTNFNNLLRPKVALCKLISHHHVADQFVEADRKVKGRCIGVVTRSNKEKPVSSRRIESQPFNSASQQRLFHRAAENSTEAEAIK